MVIHLDRIRFDLDRLTWPKKEYSRTWTPDGTVTAYRVLDRYVRKPGK